MHGLSWTWLFSPNKLLVKKLLKSPTSVKTVAKDFQRNNIWSSIEFGCMSDQSNINVINVITNLIAKKLLEDTKQLNILKILLLNIDVNNVISSLRPDQISIRFSKYFRRLFVKLMLVTMYVEILAIMMSLTTLSWRLYVSSKMLVAVSRHWQNHYVCDVTESVNNISNRSPIPQSCHQHNLTEADFLI